VKAQAIRVRGLVQGVGFRPTVWRLARECALRGDVRNDGQGVLVRALGEADAIEGFCRRLLQECPPLGRIDALERTDLTEPFAAVDFSIVASDSGEVRTGVVADAATCQACLQEIRDPANRRYRYPFTNCTHCGPRLSIVGGIPYDRVNTSMAVFPMCADCEREYRDPADRRFHAQPNACPMCGPRAWLQDARGRDVALAGRDAIGAASRLLAAGKILAIKGIGGFHLACDACDEEAVGRLRRRKRRYRKPFALMARDLAVIRRYCRLDDQEERLLQSTAAPVVLLDATGPQAVAADVAPGQDTLGFMLPYSPLHHLLMADWGRPLVMTSGNLSEEPQCIANGEAGERLAALADFQLLHDRDILNRVDDSVLRSMGGKPRFLRRARGYAPSPIPLPPGFAEAPSLLAMGGELKNTLCLLEHGQAILSQHLGDLEEARTADEYLHAIDLYRDLYRHRPRLLAVDEHPGYRSTRIGRELAARQGLDLVSVQHHHAHIASVLADNGYPLDAAPVIGIALDGLGFGPDGTLWGGEFLLADYRGYRRLAHLKTTPMPGGTRAILEPWRNAYAHLDTHLGWERVCRSYPDLELLDYLRGKPLDMLGTMLERGLNSPVSSSCGRLFDAVAAVLGLSPDAVSYEGQAAIELEALAGQCGSDAGGGYPFATAEAGDMLSLDPAPMWERLLNDLDGEVESGVIAARFHRGLAEAVADLAIRVAGQQGIGSVALSGGVFQNRTLFEAVAQCLADAGLNVLSHETVPTNDGGLSLGQAAVAAVRWLG
jgi:hydrogenase maturation protein HypF